MEVRFIAVALALCAAAAVPAQDVALAVYPAKITLDSARDRHRVVVIATDAHGVTREVSDAVKIEFEPKGLVELVDGRVRGLIDGTVELHAVLGDLRASSAIEVRHATSAPPVSFRNDVIATLTRAGCNAGSCHGAKAGKNGFGLSLFGFDPGHDHRALTREARGRRIDCADPIDSLMLQKPLGNVRHQGGKRLEPGGPLESTLQEWIAEGAPDDGGAAPKLESLTVEPKELVFLDQGDGRRARLVVTARYADGSLRDVTDLALLSSTGETVAKVDGQGIVTAGARGEAFVLARFGSLAEVAQIMVVPDAEPFDPALHPPANHVDELVYAKLRKLRLEPAGICDDDTYVRRLYLDLIGRTPTADEVRSFLADDDADKRGKLCDDLLSRDEFADVWASQWAEVLRIESFHLERKGMVLYSQWLREMIRTGVPFDEMVRRMLTSSGGSFSVPETNYWVVTADPKVLAEDCAQAFLGLRVQCAQCHNHPFERWTMDDYYGFAAFFGRVGRKNGEDARETIVYDRGAGGVRNERTGKTAVPRFLGGAEPEIPAGTDRRQVLADWLTSKDNRWFAANVANRVWARLFGRGLVEPVDDLRVSNPPTHPELYRWLGEQLANNGFDVRALFRTIVASNTYQAAADPDGAPAAAYAGRIPRRMSAEQMLDSIGCVTGVPTKLRGVPLGESSVLVADANPGNRFLDLFGRPRRSSACACERRAEPTLNQVLHLINGETVEAKVRAKDSRLARLLAADTPQASIVDDLFLAAYARAPRPEEREKVLAQITGATDATVAWQDLLWAMLNSKEFLFQH